MDNTSRKQSFRESESSPIAVIISDVHYSLTTLELANTAFRAAIDKAANLGIPLIDAGDITNDKAILRAEVMNKLIDTMKYANSRGIRPYLLVGNHSLVNEKGHDHALNFLQPYATIIDKPQLEYFKFTPVFLIPYQSDPAIFSEIKMQNYTQIYVCHQGFKGAWMGDYVQDKTSVDPICVKDYTVISGHYHRHQTVGTVTYIGSPYTMSFGEANDGPKGFLVLNSDGTFTREILSLRKHVVIESDISDLHELVHRNPMDLVWLKVTGPHSELNKIDKTALSEKLGIMNLKLDLIPNDSQTVQIEPTASDDAILDQLIDNLGETDEHKDYLKRLWRTVICE